MPKKPKENRDRFKHTLRLSPELHEKGEEAHWRLRLSWQKMTVTALEEFLAKHEEKEQK